MSRVCVWGLCGTYLSHFARLMRHILKIMICLTFGYFVLIFKGVQFRLPETCIETYEMTVSTCVHVPAMSPVWSGGTLGNCPLTAQICHMPFVPAFRMFGWCQIFTSNSCNELSHTHTVDLLDMSKHEPYHAITDCRLRVRYAPTQPHNKIKTKQQQQIPLPGRPIKHFSYGVFLIKVVHRNSRR